MQMGDNTAHVYDPNMIKHKQHFLYPGTVFARMEPHHITTVLGSCIAVCLWDQKRRIGGMNHFLLPEQIGDDVLTPRYGDIAISHLLQRMLNLGSKREDLVAKMFGGAAVLQIVTPNLSVGSRNIQMAYDILKQEKIRVISKDVGGSSGRKIMFNTYTGTVRVKTLQETVFVENYRMSPQEKGDRQK